MTCSSEFLIFFSGNISPVLPCRRQICWCSGMFSCVNGAARGPQGQLAMLCVFFRRIFTSPRYGQAIMTSYFFQHFHMDKLWQVDCCLNKTPYRLLEGSHEGLNLWMYPAKENWVQPTDQQHVRIDGRIIDCPSWAIHMPEIHGNSLTVKICRHCLKICRTSPILIPETARILLNSEDFTFLIGFAVITGRDREDEIGRTMDSQFVQMRR